MTRDEILDFANRTAAGGTVKVDIEGDELVLDLGPVIEQVAKAAMELEREACAKVCEEVMRGRSEPSDAGMCAAAIRGRV